MKWVLAWLRSLRPDPGTLRQDAVAGVPGAIASVPDGMASAVLVGVNPVYGLYASMAGPIGGGAGGQHAADGRHDHDAPRRSPPARRWAPSRAPTVPRRCSCCPPWPGVMMIVAGVLRWGRFTRFVSVSVLTGFLSGVAREHRPGPARRPARLAAEGQPSAGESLERDHPPGRDVADRSGGRRVGAGADGRAEPHPDRVGRLAGGAGRADAA